ncbi:MAG: molybdenum cofactor guanylyltransferase [Acidobacteriota bacterium]|nr:molybdenum cofactor guanylyltransferase [Acidobacteriota bacterium]
MRIPFPAAVLAGGASRRMGVPKGSLPYGAGTLAEHQTRRLEPLFSEVWLVVRDEPGYAFGAARLLFDSDPERSVLSGVTRALEEATDRVFVLAVDLPLAGEDLLLAIARRSLETEAAAVLPASEEGLEPLAGVWRRSVLPEAHRRAATGDRSLRRLAEAVGVEILPPDQWRAADPSGNAFRNLNTISEWAVARERA